jgi:hypothetical protein
MIPTINRVVHCKWPQIERRLLGPLKDRVQHHSTRPRGDFFDGSFGRTVLVVRSDAGKSYSLTFIVEVILELGSVKMCVIDAKGFDLDIELPRSFLKTILAFQCFSDSQGDLVMMVDKSCLAVNEDGASSVPFLRLLFSESGGETTRQSRHILVEMNDVARIDCGIVQVSLASVKHLRRRC